MAPRKLSPEQVAKIRTSTLPLRELAEEFGVTKVAIWQARSGGTYKDLPNATPAMLMRECQFCYELYQPKRQNQKHCSTRCSKKAESRRAYSKMRYGVEAGDPEATVKYEHLKTLRRNWYRQRVKDKTLCHTILSRS